MDSTENSTEPQKTPDAPLGLQTAGAAPAPGVQPPAPQPAPAVTDAAHPKFKSFGAKAHNMLTYQGVDWLLNATFGVSFSYFADRTKLGKAYSRTVNGFFSKALSPVLKDAKSLEVGAMWGSRFANIMIGGFAIIPLMTMLENKDNKKKIVRGIDEMVYGKDQVAHDAKFEESYKEIDNEPKKELGTGIVARILALTPLLTITSIPTTNNFMTKHIYNRVGSGTKWAAEHMGIKPAALLKRGEMVHPNSDPKLAKVFQSDWNYIHETIGFDFGLTFIYSFLHEGIIKAISGFGSKTQPQTTPAPAPQEAPMQAAPAAPSAPEAPPLAPAPSTKIQTEGLEAKRDLAPAQAQMQPV